MADNLSARKYMSDRQAVSAGLNGKARDLAQAEAMAMMLANTRDSSTIEITDIVAGIYIIRYEKLRQYWSCSDAFEELVEDQCGINRERWLYWYQYCEQFFQAHRPWNFVRYFSTRYRKWSFKGKKFKYSAELEAAYQKARVITQPSFGKVPLSSERLLLAIASLDTKVSQSLRDSGLDVSSLEQAVRSEATRR